jgi:hypothetical protein
LYHTVPAAGIYTIPWNCSLGSYCWQGWQKAIFFSFLVDGFLGFAWVVLKSMGFCYLSVFAKVSILFMTVRSGIEVWNLVRLFKKRPARIRIKP